MEIILNSPNAKYYPDFNDNRDMKTFKTQLIVPFVITLLLTGCMPDSLTKFKKEEPTKKPVAASTKTADSGTVVVPPVVDETGAPITFDEPTYFQWGSAGSPAISAPVGTKLNVAERLTEAFIDGSLGEATKFPVFFDRCELVTTGVNAQAAALPAGVTMITTQCKLGGNPTVAKSIVTAFCSDGVSPDQATCEANPLVWNATTSTCSLPDLDYATASTCGAAFHKWYPVGGPVPYRVRLDYHNQAGVQRSIYSTINFATYEPLSGLSYTQSNKIILKVSGTGSYAAITPLLTTTATVGAYPRAAMIVSNADVAGVAKVVDSTLTTIGVNKLIPVKVTSTTPFIVNTFVSKQGDSSRLGKIFKIDAGNRILYIENLSADNKTFAKTDLICSNTITGACGTSYAILDISDSYTYKKDQTLDNDKQYYSERFKIITATNVFEVGSPIHPIQPITTAAFTTTNGVSYSVSPALPCNDPLDPTDCISLDPLTGVVSGTFSSFLPNTEFTISASNPISSTSYKLNLGAIVGPGDMSLTNKQIITVTSTAFFLEGETIYQPITPPLTEALNAKILKVLNPYQLAIETFNGEFLPGASLDNNGSAYKSEKATIIPFSSCPNTFYTTQSTCELAGYAWSPATAIHYSVALTTDTSGAYVAGNSISSASGTGIGAIGQVAHVLTAANDVLFVQYLTGNNTSTSGAKTFYEGDVLNATTPTTVTQVEATNIKFTIGALLTIPAPVAGTAGNVNRFMKGSDIVTGSNTAAYVYSAVGNDTSKVLSVREISKAAGGVTFQAGQMIYNHETVALSTNNSTIAANSVTFENFFVFESGKNMTLKGNISSGNGIIYSITPPLPPGLVLDTLTGSIKGSATTTSARKDYLITGVNFIGTSFTVISLEVKDYFELQEKSGAASFLLHKVGDYQNNRKCRVDASDILSLSNSKALDIRCFLDGEEQDVYQSEIIYKAIAGAGICEYVQYAPYYFNSFSPAQSFQTSTKYPTQTITRTGCTSVIDSGSIPTPAMCEGNYSSIDSSYPDCDEGTLTYWAETYNDTCGLTGRIQKTVNCGGDKSKCVAGPARDIFTNSQIRDNFRTRIAPAISGAALTFTHASSIDKGDSTNIRHANGTIANQCFSSAADSATWRTETKNTNILASPLASDSNPFYTFTCLNSAYEIKARIRVIVREWNETFRISDNIFNQSFLAPATQMNRSGLDPIFMEQFNNYADWDDTTGSRPAPTFTGGSCGIHAAGSCTLTDFFESDLQCTSVGGTVVNPASCTDAARTTKAACEYTVPAAAVWTNTDCRFNNQYQCNLYGGVWTGDEEYKFPGSLLGY